MTKKPLIETEDKEGRKKGEIMWVFPSHFSWKTPGLRHGCDEVDNFEAKTDSPKLCQETNDLYALYRGKSVHLAVFGGFTNLQ